MKIQDLRRLELRPGDRILMKLDIVPTPEQTQRIKAVWKDFAPEVEVLVIPDGASIDILSVDES